MFKAWPIYRFIPRVILFATLICGPTAASGAPEWDVHEWLEKFAGSQVGWKYLTHSDLGITSVRLDVITDPVYPIVLFWMRTDYQNFLQTERGPVGSDMERYEVNCATKTYRLSYLAQYEKPGNQGRRLYLTQDAYVEVFAIPQDTNVYDAMRFACAMMKPSR